MWAAPSPFSAPGSDIHYPPENEDLRRALEAKGLVVTEFGPGTRPEARNFPFRNRIISGLSLGVLVAEAASRSGSLITARLATEQGREVFALPGPLGQPTFAGCHKLIKQGAALVENAEDIIRALRYQFAAELVKVPASLPAAEPLQPQSAAAHAAAAPAPAEPPRQPKSVPENITKDERALLDALTLDGKTHIDTLIQALEADSAAVSRRLLVLEMQGLVRQWPGMYYSLA
jgi:Predicted Rossmann fold nucleotide-binding protein involved in DNA uptake